MFASKMKFSHHLIARQQCMDRAPQLANSFAMNNPYPQDSAFTTLNQVLGDNILYLLRTERVQVQHAVNWQRNRFVVSIHG